MQRLLGIETNILISIDMHGWFSSYLIFWTTFAPRVLFLQILCKVLFKILLQIVKGTWIRLRKAFLRFEIFSPCLKCFSFDLNKTPPQWNSPLSVQEGFRYEFLKVVTPIWKGLYQFEKSINNKILIENHEFLKIRWWCGPFALGSCSLLLWHKSPKTESLEPFPNYFLPFGK